ncbi:MAG: hypothetical protein ABSB63_14200 [Spirochaetia bacterium]
MREYALGPKAVPRGIAGLIVGLLLFDLLVNLPGWSPGAPVSSLLAPSVDLLLVAAALMGAAGSSFTVFHTLSREACFSP